MNPVERVLEAVDDYEERANGFWALCPAHDDHDPSLHVEEGEDGRVLMVCRAGCSQAEVLAALEERGLSRRDLFDGDSDGSVVPLRHGRPKGPGRSLSHDRGRLVEVYDVKDASGRLVAIHERWEGSSGKSFLWKHPNGRYSRSGEVKPGALPLYGSEHVGRWRKDGSERGIVLVEGERAADALRALGIRALGTVTGANGTHTPEVLEILANLRVVLWPDGDDSGRAHMRRHAERLVGVAAELRRFEWEGPADVKGPDAADYPAVVTGDLAGLQALARELAEAPAWEPEPLPSAGLQPSSDASGAEDDRVRPSFNLTDLGNSERFVAEHGEDVRYCYSWGKWLVWAGARWERDDTGRVHRLAKQTVRSIYGEAFDAEDEGRRKDLAKHAATSESETRIRAMLELAKSEVPISPDELDADPWLLNVENGTVDLRTGELQGYRREDLITKLASVRYDPYAAAPEWDRFLERVLPAEDLRDFVRRASGYSATGDTSEQCMFINHGTGSNGKSTFQETLASALGDYAMRAPTQMLMARRPGGVPNDVARLKGARFVTASETEEGRSLAESLVKDLTGQDTISARFMRAEWFDFTPTHKLWLSTNHKPEIRGTDNAIWRRIRLVPWDVTIPPSDRDRKLPEKLRAELPGILAWVVRGCLEWSQEGLRAPEEVRRATGNYRAEMDPLRDFFAERCVLALGTWAMSADLLAAYDRWRLPNNERDLSMTRFGKMLVERGFRRDRVKTGPDKGKVIYLGIGLKTDGESSDGATNPSLGEGLHENPSPDESAANKPKTANRTGTVKSGEGKRHINTSENSLVRGSVEKHFTTLHQGQTLHQEEHAAKDLEEPSSMQNGRCLTEEEAQRIRRLIHEGMSPKIARQEVLKKET